MRATGTAMTNVVAARSRPHDGSLARGKILIAPGLQKAGNFFGGALIARDETNIGNGNGTSDLSIVPVSVATGPGVHLGDARPDCGTPPTPSGRPRACPAVPAARIMREGLKHLRIDARQMSPTARTMISKGARPSGSFCSDRERRPAIGLTARGWLLCTVRARHPAVAHRSGVGAVACQRVLVATSSSICISGSVRSGRLLQSL